MAIEFTPEATGRRTFIGGSDARIIMGDDGPALQRLWREKRGEVDPEDLSGNLIVQLGRVTEGLNRRWYQAQTGRVVTDVQMWRRHPTLHWMAATLDGRVEGGDVFESKFMLPWQFSEEAAAEKHMPQLQHNMWVVAARAAVLSVITGGGKWVEIKTTRIRSISTLFLRPSVSSGAASRLGSPLRYSGLSRLSRASRRCALST
jgi:predicted phage-related endonuclease